MKKLILLLIAFTFLATGAQAGTSSKSLVRDGEKALAEGEARYALYKFRQAWLDMSEMERTSPFGTSLKEDIVAAFAVNGDKADATSYAQTPPHVLTERIQWRTELGSSSWRNWSIKLESDNALALEPNKASLVSGRTPDGYQQFSSEQRESRMNIDKSIDEWVLEKYANMPLRIKPGEPHYEEMLKLASLRSGESKLVEFDLNPFLPKAFAINEF